MDPTQAIILTTIFNVVITGLVGGIVIYTLQKRIDATIQKSLVEHQLKISRSYPKRLDVLETLHEKIVKFRYVYWEVTVHMEAKMLRKRALLIDEDFQVKSQEAMITFAECGGYFRENRMYLPEGSIEELEKIIDKLHALEFYLSIWRPDLGKPQEHFSEFLDGIIANRYHLSFLRFVNEMPFQDINPADQKAPVVFIRVIRQEVDKLTQQFERLYRSLAEAQ